MTVSNRTCSVCGSEFELHFRYQQEERRETAPDGQTLVRESFYCSQRCLEASHSSRADGMVTCDACARHFEVELAGQVLFTGGQRHYACSPRCRARVLEGARAVRLGQLLDPNYALAEGGEEIAQNATFPTSSASVKPAAVLRSSITTSLPRSQRPPPPRRFSPSSPEAAARARVLAVFNHKGGTGKTTTAVHVAAGLAERGQKVLLVDTDGQGNVATSLGVSFERSLYHVIVMGLPYKDACVEARPCLDVVPSNETLAAAELYIAGQRERDRILARRFAQARAQYDYVIVDCSPSLSLMNQNALVMADAVLCPVACDYLSLVGIQKVVRTVKQVNRLLSHPLGFWGVLPTFFDSRARICHEALDTLRSHFKEVCLAPVRLASKVKEAPAHGKTLFEYAPTSTAAEDYRAVVDRLLVTEQSGLPPRVAEVAERAVGGAA